MTDNVLRNIEKQDADDPPLIVCTGHSMLIHLGLIRRYARGDLLIRIRPDGSWVADGDPDAGERGA
jgi:hypothetical protein